MAYWKNTFVAAVLMALLIPAGSWAEEKIHHEAGISFEVPENWLYELDGTGTYLSSSNGELVLALVSVPLESIEEVMDATAKELSLRFEDLVFGDPESGQIDGMDFFYTFGPATMDGSPVAIELGILMSTQPLIINTIITQEGLALEAELTEFLRSIRKLNRSIDQ